MGGAAQSVREKKDAKYDELAKTYTFIAIACETLGPINTEALSFSFLTDLGCYIALATHAKEVFYFNASPSLSNVITLTVSKALLPLQHILRASCSSGKFLTKFNKCHGSAVLSAYKNI